MNFIGIDCGKSGAIAVIKDDDDSELECTKLDNTERDIWAALSMLDPFESAAVIERIVAMPKSGKSQMAKLAQNYGFMRGLLIAAEITFDEMLPREWQKEMKCLTKGDKNISKARAQQLFPKYPVYHWNADAILLAVCSRRKYVLQNGLYSHV